MFKNNQKQINVITYKNGVPSMKSYHQGQRINEAKEIYLAYNLGDGANKEETLLSLSKLNKNNSKKIDLIIKEIKEGK